MNAAAADGTVFDRLFEVILDRRGSGPVSTNLEML